MSNKTWIMKLKEKERKDVQEWVILKNVFNHWEVKLVVSTCILIILWF